MDFKSFSLNRLMLISFVILVLTSFSIDLIAQTDAQKAQIRVHMTNANSALQGSNWDQALSNVSKAQDVLGSSAAIFESVRVKAYHGKKDYQKAKEHLLIFFQLSPADNLIDEIAPISADIDEKLEAKRKKEEEARRREQEKRALERKKEKEELEKRKLIESFRSSINERKGSYIDEKDLSEYPTIQIGNQRWMSENLKVKTFQNGDIIKQVKSYEDWINAKDNKEPVWAFYDFDSKNSKYGIIYNWYAINDSRGLAPKGWKLPSEDDWEGLVKSLGPSEQEINDTGFNVLFAGHLVNPTFLGHVGQGDWTYWWSSDGEISHHYTKENGFNTMVLHTDEGRFIRLIEGERTPETEAKQKYLRKKKAIQVEKDREIFENKIADQLSQLDNLEEGRAYQVTYRKSLSSGGNDQAIFVYFDDRFIIYTVPYLGLVNRLFKDRVSITSNMASGRNVAEVKSKNGYGKRVNIRFQAGTHYNNVFLGGFGDDLLWTSGEQNTVFEQFVYYYYELSGATPVLKADIEMKKDFSKAVLNPYIETGTIERTVDYELIKNPELQDELKENSFDNLPSTDLDEPNSVQVTLETKDNGLTILYPTKNITYALHDKVKGEYTYNNSSYKGQFLHFLPQKVETHYGFMRVGTSYPSRDLFSAINFTPISTYKMSKTVFDSIYESINNPELEVGKTRYFTSTNYKTIFEEIPKLLSK